jgi:ssDNA-binding Zn-finger/Zn-ribbon topoisomerase 1
VREPANVTEGQPEWRDLEEVQEAVTEDVPAAERDVEGAGPPLCPRCGRPMVVRVASRGAHEGERFWRCADYPCCRGVRAYWAAREG